MNERTEKRLDARTAYIEALHLANTLEAVRESLSEQIAEAQEKLDRLVKREKLAEWQKKLDRLEVRYSRITAELTEARKALAPLADAAGITRKKQSGDGDAPGFDALVSDFEIAAIDWKNGRLTLPEYSRERRRIDDAFSVTAYELAGAAVYSYVRRINDKDRNGGVAASKYGQAVWNNPEVVNISSVNDGRGSDNGFSPVLTEILRTVQADKIDLIVSAIISGGYYDNGKAISKAARDEMCDREKQCKTARNASDLVQAFVTALTTLALEYADMPGWFNREVMHRRIVRTVYDRHKKPEYKEKAVPVRKLAYEELSNAIENSSAGRDLHNGYDYLEEYVDADGNETSAESAGAVRIYRRSISRPVENLYNGIISSVPGAPDAWYKGDGLATVSADYGLYLDSVADALQLNAKERRIFERMADEYSHTVIAESESVSVSTVKRIGRDIISRLIDAGYLDPAKMEAVQADRKSKQAARVCMIDPLTGAIVSAPDTGKPCIFDSVNQAARATGYSKGKISEAVAGKRKTYNGYIWKPYSVFVQEMEKK